MNNCVICGDQGRDYFMEGVFPTSKYNIIHLCGVCAKNECFELIKMMGESRALWKLLDGLTYEEGAEWVRRWGVG